MGPSKNRLRKRFFRDLWSERFFLEPESVTPWHPSEEPFSAPGDAPWGLLTLRDLTQVKMEKKEKVMAARAASPPSFRGLSSSLLTCH